MINSLSPTENHRDGKRTSSLVHDDKLAELLNSQNIGKNYMLTNK